MKIPQTIEGVRFIVDGMPRTGSTSLARMLSSHESISCLIEPFHPERYQGRFHRASRNADSLRAVLDSIWTRWQSIKHVWQPIGDWPFAHTGDLNQKIIRYAPAVISVRRENLFQRYVSDLISKKLSFWMGSRTDFLHRLDHLELKELNPERAASAIARDHVASKERMRLIAETCAHSTFITYEELFDPQVTDQERIATINNILNVLGYSRLTPEDLLKPTWQSATDRDISKWNTPDVYERIPGIRKLEEKIGADETGWLFR